MKKALYSMALIILLSCIGATAAFAEYPTKSEYPSGITFPSSTLWEDQYKDYILNGYYTITDIV